MKIDQLVKEPLIIEWFSNIQAAENTKVNFLQGMRYYTDFIKKTPNELLESAEEEINDGILMRKRKIKEHMLTFREWSKGQGFAPKTVHNHMTAVKSFYRSFDIDLPQLNNKKSFKVLATEENGITITKEQIQALLVHANVRNRAIILAMASSGLAQSDILDLKIKDFRRGYDLKSNITTLRLRRIKTQYDFITFFSPEASKAIVAYLKYRDQVPKDKNESLLIAYEKRRIRSDDNYLFCKHDVPERYLQTLDEKDRKLNTQGLMDLFRELAKKTGLDTAFGVWQIARAHNLRKFFNSALLNNGADIFFTDYIMGHQIDAMHEAYYKADPVKLREKYKRYLPFISLTDREDYIIETEEFVKLRAENEVLKKQISGIESKLEEQKNKEAAFDLDFEKRFAPLIEKKASEILDRKIKEHEKKG